MEALLSAPCGLRCQPEHLGQLQKKGTDSPLSRGEPAKEEPRSPAVALSYISPILDNKYKRPSQTLTQGQSVASDG